MSKYRNRYFLFGVLLLLGGVQFRMIDSFLLNESTTRVLAKVTKSSPVADNTMAGNLFWSVAPAPRKRVQPPRWLGLAMIAMGSVIGFHALAIPRYHGGHD